MTVEIIPYHIFNPKLKHLKKQHSFH